MNIRRNHLSALIGSQSVLSFARACGIAESVLRTYLHDGRMPPLDKALAIATAAGVSLDWLAGGGVPAATTKVPAVDGPDSGNTGTVSALGAPPPEFDVLEAALKAALDTLGTHASPEQIATLAVEYCRRERPTRGLG